MDPLADRDDVNAMLVGIWDANRKLDDVLSYLYEDDDGEEEETDAEP
jgi:hypothetical protein